MGLPFREINNNAFLFNKMPYLCNRQTKNETKTNYEKTTFYLPVTYFIVFF